MAPICVPCQRYFRPIKNGFLFIEGMPTENGAPCGTEAPEMWEPYKLWSGDKWKCQGCGAEIVSGVGLEPIAEHYQDGFAAKAERSQLQVNDCC